MDRYIGDEDIDTKLNKGNLSYSIVNTIGGKYLKGLKRPNKHKIYNSNTPKNRNKGVKRLALLNGNLSK